MSLVEDDNVYNVPSGGKKKKKKKKKRRLSMHPSSNPGLSEANRQGPIDIDNDNGDLEAYYHRSKTQ